MIHATEWGAIFLQFISLALFFIGLQLRYLSQKILDLDRIIRCSVALFGANRLVVVVTINTNMLGHREL